MRILAGIPTRLRSTSGKIADILAEVCDEVVIISQGATCVHNSNKVTIVEKDVNFGLVPARNAILDYAVEHSYDIVIQSDDDLAYYPKTVEALIKEIVDNPTLGAICSESRAYFNWGKDVHTTKNFILSPCSPQLWAARTSILTEVGYWTCPFLEDREHGARMWKSGYAIGQLHISLDLAHNCFISRNTDSKKSGGQTEDSGRTGLSKAIEYMQSTHRDIIRIGGIDADHRKFMTRYNWPWMVKLVTDRFGKVLGYEDSKGRIL
jgi:glycosyltransferase involved in cell wall biosynthesis